MRNLLLTVASSHVALHFNLSTLHSSLITFHSPLFTFHFSLFTFHYNLYPTLRRAVHFS